MQPSCTPKERASQKFGRIDESFLHDYKLDEDVLDSIQFLLGNCGNHVWSGNIEEHGKKIFKLTDKDNDGKISINEVRMEYDKANMKLHSARNIDTKSPANAKRPRCR